MKAIILAGGRGLRLREVVKEVPKPMAPVAGRPFLEYLICQLVLWDIKEVILSIGYKGEAVSSYFQDGSRWGICIRYSKEDSPLGTGGALRKAAQLIDDEQVVVLNGDSFLRANIDELISCHKNKRSMATLGLAWIDDIQRYGAVEIDEVGRIVRFCEKKPGGKGLINGGLYIFSRDFIQSISQTVASLEKEILPRWLQRGLYGVVVKDFFVDIGIPQDYVKLCEEPALLLSILN